MKTMQQNGRAQHLIDQTQYQFLFAWNNSTTAGTNNSTSGPINEEVQYNATKIINNVTGSAAKNSNNVSNVAALHHNGTPLKLQSVAFRAVFAFLIGASTFILMAYFIGASHHRRERGRRVAEEARNVEYSNQKRARLEKLLKKCSIVSWVAWTCSFRFESSMLTTSEPLLVLSACQVGGGRKASRGQSTRRRQHRMWYC